MCVHQALIEANAQYRLVLVDLRAGRQRDPAYLKLNPGGLVPTLLIDDAPFTETAAPLMQVQLSAPEHVLPQQPGNNFPQFSDEQKRLYSRRRGNPAWHTRK